MGIETILPVLPPGGETASSRDAHDEILERAGETMRVLRELVPCAAYLLHAWDPISGSHVHRELASDGYSESTIAHVNDAYVGESAAFRLAHTSVARALRWRDYARLGLDFSKSLTAEEFLIPSGFHEGTTVCLRLPDGRYTGSLHMSWSAPSGATDERRETIERFRPILASVCDMLRAPQILVEALAPGAGAIVISSEGMAVEVPGRQTGPELAQGTRLRALLPPLARTRGHHRFLWTDQAGRCHRVELIPYRGGVSLVTEETISWPYGLTTRELQILHLVAGGHSNPEIAHRLVVSPRTISTHVEHILAKLGCSSRTQLAAKAVSEGLILAEDPRTEPIFRR